MSDSTGYLLFRHFLDHVIVVLLLPLLLLHYKIQKQKIAYLRPTVYIYHVLVQRNGAAKATSVMEGHILKMLGISMEKQ